MLWGFFTITHIASLILGVAIIIGLYFVLRNRSDKTKLIVLGILSFSGISAIVFNLVAWNSPLEYLPLHLCSLNALVLPIAVLSKSKKLNNLLLLWSLGALFALVVNTAQANFDIFSLTFAFYYFPHVLELGIPILMFALKLVKKDFKCIVSTVGITLVSYTLIHFINVAINSYCIGNNVLDQAGNVIQVNYMYSLTPANPLLQIFYNLIPAPYWYMLLCVPIVVIFLGVVYLGDILALRKKANN